MLTDDERMLSSSSDDDDDNFPGFSTYGNHNRINVLRPCGSNCKRFLSDAEDILVCDICKSSFHLTCTTFNNQVFQVLKEKDSFRDVFWKCSTCKVKAREPCSNSIVIEMIEALQTRVSNLEYKAKKSTVV